MAMAVQKTKLDQILPLRALFLEEMNRQIRYNAVHERGRSDEYLLTIDEEAVGYGSIKGREAADRDTVFEFYVVPPFRKYATALFRALLDASAPSWVECQSNDFLLSSMLFEFAHSITADTVLFEDYVTTQYTIPGAVVHLKREDETIFEHRFEPTGEYVLELRGEIVATGGFMLHYNHPFADLYMEVREDSRNCGLGSFLLQEVKKQCFLHGRVPAARCAIGNKASRGCLRRAGLRECGFMLTGTVAPEVPSKL